jgi:hypothetical protein
MARHDTGPVPYPVALALTLVVEVPVYVVVLRRCGLLPGWRAWAGAVGVNLLTHPVVWVLLSARPAWFVPVEAAVAGIEASLLYAWVRRDLLVLVLAAVVANTASVLAGLAL